MSETICDAGPSLGLGEFLGHFVKNTVFLAKNSPSGLELLMKDLESLGLKLAKNTPPPQNNLVKNMVETGVWRPTAVSPTDTV